MIQINIVYLVEMLPNVGHSKYLYQSLIYFMKMTYILDINYL